MRKKGINYCSHSLQRNEIPINKGNQNELTFINKRYLHCE